MVCLKGLESKWLYTLLKNKKDFIKNDDWKILRKKGKDAIDLIQKIVNEEGLDCHFRRGYILEIHINGKNFKHAIEYASQLRKDGLNIEVLDYNEIREMEKKIGEDVIGGLHYIDDASMNPAEYLKALEERVKKYGKRGLACILNQIFDYTKLQGERFELNDKSLDGD